MSCDTLNHLSASFDDRTCDALASAPAINHLLFISKWLSAFLSAFFASFHTFDLLHLFKLIKNYAKV